MLIAASGMEQVRDLLMHGIHVNSWLRVLRLNRAIGSNDTSDHIEGWAIDFICPAFGTPKEICIAIRDSDIVFNKLIYEGEWVHISFHPDAKKQLLTAVFNNGKATYRQGIV